MPLGTKGTVQTADNKLCFGKLGKYLGYIIGIFRFPAPIKLSGALDSWNHDSKFPPYILYF